MDRTRLLVVVVLLFVACIGLWWVFFPRAAPPAVVPDGSVDPGISVPESALSDASISHDEPDADSGTRMMDNDTTGSDSVVATDTSTTSRVATVDLGAILDEAMAPAAASTLPISKDPETGSITGLATLNGEAIANVNVNIHQRDGANIMKNVVTTEDGYFDSGPVPAGEYLVTATARQLPASNREANRAAIVETGAVTEMDFPFETGSTAVTGTVTIDGEPVVSAQISGWVAAASGEHKFMTSTDAAGVFAAEGLPEGTTRVRVKINAGEELRLTQDQLVDLVAGQTATADFAFTGGGKISGYLHNYGGNDGVVLYHGHREMPHPSEIDAESFAEMNSHLYKNLSADGEGYFTDAGIAPGNYTVVGYSAAGDQLADFRTARYAVVHIVVRDGEEQTFDLVLETLLQGRGAYPRKRNRSGNPVWVVPQWSG